MDRKHWKKMLPVIEAFVEGKTLTNPEGDEMKDPFFNQEPAYYRIAKPKERVPLEAEDWIKDGPWWVRYKAKPSQIAMICAVVDGGFLMPALNIGGTMKVPFDNPDLDFMERRNAASDWMPCWKEKE